MTVPLALVQIHVAGIRHLAGMARKLATGYIIIGAPNRARGIGKEILLRHDPKWIQPVRFCGRQFNSIHQGRGALAVKFQVQEPVLSGRDVLEDPRIGDVEPVGVGIDIQTREQRPSVG